MFALNETRSSETPNRLGGRNSGLLFDFNPLKTKRRPLYLKTISYRAVNTFHLGYKNQSVYAVSGTSRYLFPDECKTHKYSVGGTYGC